MARFNTSQSTISVTSTTTLTYVIDKSTILLTGSSGYTLTLASPAAFPGTIQNLYNATGGNVTIASASGNLIGSGFVAATSQIIPDNTAYTVTSNGTNYIITNNQGGPVSATTATFSSSVTMSPVNATVTISPTGTGTLTVAPATAGTINNVSIGATTRAAGNFTTLDANSTVGLSGSNAAVTISPTGTGGVTISPAGSASVTMNPTTTGNINNMNIGGTTRAAGAFTTLGANNTVTLNLVTIAQSSGTISTSSGNLTLDAATGSTISVSKALSMGANQISSSYTPASANDLTNKAYVDANTSKRITAGLAFYGAL